MQYRGDMSPNEVVHGPTSEYVVAEVKRRRRELRWSLEDLSDRLREVGRPLRATGVHRLENGRRRIDVDDLIGLAEAFDVTPIHLLPPQRGAVAALADATVSDLVTELMAYPDFARRLANVLTQLLDDRTAA